MLKGSQREAGRVVADFDRFSSELFTLSTEKEVIDKTTSQVSLKEQDVLIMDDD